MIVRRSFTCVVLLVAVLWAMAIAADPAMEWLLFAVTFPLLWACLAWAGILLAERRTRLPGEAGWRTIGQDPSHDERWAAEGLARRSHRPRPGTRAPA